MGDDILGSAEWHLDEHFPGVDHATCYYVRPLAGQGGSMWWIVYLHTTEFKTDPGAKVFEASAGDLGWAMCAALQVAADAGLYRPVPPPSSPSVA